MLIQFLKQRLINQFVYRVGDVVEIDTTDREWLDRARRLIRNGTVIEVERVPEEELDQEPVIEEITAWRPPEESEQPKAPAESDDFPDPFQNPEDEAPLEPVPPVEVAVINRPVEKATGGPQRKGTAKPKADDKLTGQK